MRNKALILIRKGSRRLENGLVVRRSFLIIATSQVRMRSFAHWNEGANSIGKFIRRGAQIRGSAYFRDACWDEGAKSNHYLSFFPFLSFTKTSEKKNCIKGYKEYKHRSLSPRCNVALLKQNQHTSFDSETPRHA